MRMALIIQWIQGSGFISSLDWDVVQTMSWFHTGLASGNLH